MNIIKKLKENNEDFEWYPTTKEILETVWKDIKEQYALSSRMRSPVTLLDIGAGDGKVFRTFDSFVQDEFVDEHGQNRGFYFKKYAIEKSQILSERLPEDVFIIGTDFFQQTLMDKKMNIVFCNPPYSEYVNWMAKIIKEANTPRIYFVVPSRWKDNKVIQEAMEDRDVEAKFLGSFDFLNSEDRKARAKVDILKIRQKQVRFKSDEDYDLSDAFRLWFSEMFKIQKPTPKKSRIEEEDNKKTDNQEVVKGKNKITQLEEFYLDDFDRLHKSYKALESVDSSILAELKIDLDNIREMLKLKIEGLKNIYWNKLFNSIDAITCRLTSKSREKLLKTLFDNCNVDFSASNAYSIIIWAIKNANKYMDEQIVEQFYSLANNDSVKRYKSNEKVWDRYSWRYKNEDAGPVGLDYRIVVEGWGSNFYNGALYKCDFHECNLSKNTVENIKDIFVIADILGFKVDVDRAFSIEWEAGNKVDVFYEKDGKEKLFCDIKCFKNGNIHYRFCTEFIQKFNVTVGRILNWINKEEDIEEEMELDKATANRLYREGYSHHINISKYPLLN